MKKTIGLLALACVLLFSCKPHTDLDVEAFASRLQPDAQLVDVRTAEEFAAGHLPGAVNVDMGDESFLSRANASLDKRKAVLMYCRTGRRSTDAARQLRRSGFGVYTLDGGYQAWQQAGKTVSRNGYEVERFYTDGGLPVDITLIKHGSLEIRFRELSIQVDPVTEHGKHTDYAAEFPKAGCILVTHEHGDHLDEAAIATLTDDSTRLILNPASRDLLGRGEAVANGDRLSLSEGILLEVVPAYNTTPGRERFHPKGNGNGYVLTLDGLRIYLAGDTEDIPELAEIPDVDVAFLPVNQPYTMTPEQCVHAAQMLHPKVLIPYHSGQTDLSGLPAALPDIDVRIRNMQ